MKRFIWTWFCELATAFGLFCMTATVLHASMIKTKISSDTRGTVIADAGDGDVFGDGWRWS